MGAVWSDRKKTVQRGKHHRQHRQLRRIADLSRNGAGREESAEVIRVIFDAGVYCSPIRQERDVVIPGLVPVIHVLLPSREKKTWMAGSSPAMTKKASAGRKLSHHPKSKDW